MESPLLEQVKQFLDGLEEIQSELTELFELKRRALINGRASEIETMNERERDCAARLQSLLGFRNRILTKAYGVDARKGTLELISVRHQGIRGWEGVLERIQASKETQEKLRQASWTHWIISHRCYNHYTEILDLIAHQGNKEATYSPVPHQGVRGGAMLDASC